jgi:hypothetical protein
VAKTSPAVLSWLDFLDELWVGDQHQLPRTHRARCLPLVMACHRGHCRACGDPVLGGQQPHGRATLPLLLLQVAVESDPKMRAPLSFQEASLLYPLPSSSGASTQWSLAAVLATGAAISATQFVAFINPVKSNSLMVAAIKVRTRTVQLVGALRWLAPACGGCCVLAALRSCRSGPHALQDAETTGTTISGTFDLNLTVLTQSFPGEPARVALFMAKVILFVLRGGECREGGGPSVLASFCSWVGSGTLCLDAQPQTLAYPPFPLPPPVAEQGAAQRRQQHAHAGELHRECLLCRVMHGPHRKHVPRHADSHPGRGCWQLEHAPVCGVPLGRPGRDHTRRCRWARHPLSSS